MSNIEFSKEEKTVIIEQLQEYFRDELDQDLGNFDAEFLLNFILKELGPYFYNRGLYDAQAVLHKSMDSVIEAIYTIEKRTQFRR